jgi:hypothetical protein
MTKLEEAGIEVTALHNHLLRNEPFTMYLHVLGHGDPVKLATALYSALAESRTPLESGAPSYSAPTQSIDLDTTVIDKALGYKGQTNGGVYQVSVPRAERITDGGMDVPRGHGFGDDRARTAYCHDRLRGQQQAPGRTYAVNARHSERLARRGPGCTGLR